MSEYVKNESQHKVFAEESLESTFMIFMFVNCINYHKTNLFTQQIMLYYYFQRTQKVPTFCVIHTHVLFLVTLRFSHLRVIICLSI